MQFVWCGIAVLALGWANLQIWRTRRALNQVGPDLAVPQGSSVPSPAVAEQTSPVMAR
jgi:hypothetical protein